MKPIFTTLVLLLCIWFNGASQEHTKQSNNLDDFIGIWEYKQENSFFKLILKKGTCTLNGDVFNCLIGGYQYEKNGVIEADYLDNIPTAITEDNRLAVKVWAYSLVHSGEPGKAKELSLVFVDDGKRQKFSGMNSRLSLFTNTMIDWVLEEGEQPYDTNKDGKKKRGFSVPETLLLSKRKEMEYKHLPSIDRYTGTWFYESNNETFLLTIKKGEVNTLNYHGDMALGGYKHIKNGKLLGDYMLVADVVTEDVIYTPEEPKLQGREWCENDNKNSCVLKFNFWDVGYGRATIMGSINLLSSTTALFKTWIPEIKVIVDPLTNKPKKQTVPANIVMTKIE